MKLCIYVHCESLFTRISNVLLINQTPSSIKAYLVTVYIVAQNKDVLIKINSKFAKDNGVTEAAKLSSGAGARRR